MKRFLIIVIVIEIMTFLGSCGTVGVDSVVKRSPDAYRDRQETVDSVAEQSPHVSQEQTERLKNEETDEPIQNLTSRIKQLIQQLGDNKWAKREEATEELRRIGEPAMPFLKDALANSKDAEIRLRARLLIRNIDCLIAYWKFDEASGTVARDSSGNGHYGTVHGAKWVAGKVGGALSFDGVDDYVNVPYSTLLIVTDVSLEAWIKTSDKTDHKHIISNYDTSVDAQFYHLYIRKDTGHAVFQVDDGITLLPEGYTLAPKVDGTTDVADGNWHHLVGVRDTSNGLLKIYVAGVEQNTVTDTTSGSLNSNTNLWIGGQNAWPMRYFNGTIDEVKIYNRALSAEEIKSNYEKMR